MDQVVDITYEPPDFKIGDEVVFEVAPPSPFGTAIPRWREDNVDSGSSNVWAEGVIESLSTDWVCVRYTVEGYIGEGECKFPNEMNPHFLPWQWDEPGYLQLVVKKRCECGSESIYGEDTQLHSDWCPRYNI